MTREEAIEWLELAKLQAIAQGESPEGRLCKAYSMAIEALKQPEQKNGKWIVTGTFDDFLKCSCCGYRKPWNQDIFNFCPNCGAKMDKEKLKNGEVY